MTFFGNIVFGDEHCIVTYPLWLYHTAFSGLLNEAHRAKKEGRCLCVQGKEFQPLCIASVSSSHGSDPITFGVRSGVSIAMQSRLGISKVLLRATAFRPAWQLWISREQSALSCYVIKFDFFTTGMPYEKM